MDYAIRKIEVVSLVKNTQNIRGEGGKTLQQLTQKGKTFHVF